MRSASLALVAVLAAGASAQMNETAALEANIVEALGRLRTPNPDGTTGTALAMTADESYLGRTVRTTATARWNNATENGRDVLRAEFTVTRDGTLVQRVVSDGRTVWDYDARRNRYSAQPVDRATGAQANTYRATVESALASAVGGPVADLVRLTREIAGGGFTTHRSWIPGVRPAPGRRPGEEDWAVYVLSGRNSRYTAFEMVTNEEETVFTRLRRYDETRVGTGTRLLDAVIEPLIEEVLPTSPAFVFIPPRNAVSVPARAVRY